MQYADCDGNEIRVGDRVYIRQSALDQYGFTMENRMFTFRGCSGGIMCVESDHGVVWGFPAHVIRYSSTPVSAIGQDADGRDLFVGSEVRVRLSRLEKGVNHKGTIFNGEVRSNRNAIVTGKGAIYINIKTLDGVVQYAYGDDLRLGHVENPSVESVYRDADGLELNVGDVVRIRRSKVGNYLNVDKYNRTFTIRGFDMDGRANLDRYHGELFGLVPTNILRLGAA